MSKRAERRRGWRTAVVVAVVGLLLAAGGGYWLAGRPSAAQTQPRRPPAPVPVTVAAATRQDFPIYLTGLGSVQASSTVAIHVQVDGKLQEVNFTEGEHVKKGDVLAKIDPRLYQATLDQAKAKKLEDQAQLIDAEKDLARFKTLASRSFETQQNVDLQQAKVDQLKATISADDGAIESAQTQLDYTTIIAPNDGRIGFRQVDPGNIVHASDTTPITTLTLTQPSDVVFTLPAKFLDEVRAAMARGPVEVDAFDQDNQRKLASGKLLLIDNQIDQATSTMRLKARFANQDEALWPGEFVNARVLIETRKNVLTIPSAAVQRGPDGLYAWVITPQNTAEIHPIKTGPSTDDRTIVLSGLQDGDRTVTGGDYKLQPNATVTIGPSSAGGGS
ncbi:MAG TPA: efflux RND transporter periplasmic adaptor subunit [Xanthobacteraceae bacterium]|nr:efflux RND transporter periplasmic adaptor subunit [Xanthobacteraceae bacterium]